MHKNGMFSTLISIHNHIIECQDFMLSVGTRFFGPIKACHVACLMHSNLDQTIINSPH